MFTLIPVAAVLPEQLSSPAILGYLDPGAGSMLLQVLIAGVFSSLFFAKSSISYVRDMLVSKKKSL